MENIITKEIFKEKIKKEEKIIDSFFKKAEDSEKENGGKEDIIKLFAESAIELFELK